MINFDRQLRKPLDIGFFSFLVALFGFFLAFFAKDDKGGWIYTTGYLLIYVGALSFIVAFCWLAILAVERQYRGVRGLGPNGDPKHRQRLRLPLRLSKYYADRETGTLYATRRDAYDAVTGRFGQSDPIGLNGGINTYVYTKNPLSEIDPEGLMGRAPGTSGGRVVKLKPRLTCPQRSTANRQHADRSSGGPEDGAGPEYERSLEVGSGRSVRKRCSEQQSFKEAARSTFP